MSAVAEPPGYSLRRVVVEVVRVVSLRGSLFFLSSYDFEAVSERRVGSAATFEDLIEHGRGDLAITIVVIRAQKRNRFVARETGDDMQPQVVARRENRLGAPPTTSLGGQRPPPREDNAQVREGSVQALQDVERHAHVVGDGAVGTESRQLLARIQDEERRHPQVPDGI